MPNIFGLLSILAGIVVYQHRPILAAGNDGDSCGLLLESTDTEDFFRLVTGIGVFVDKSLLIERYLDAKEDVIVVSRPRKFAKTINTNMLKRFLEISADSEKNRQLFVGGDLTIADSANKTRRRITLKPLKISARESVMKHQGRYPVIIVNFKSELIGRHYGRNYSEIVNGLKRSITNLYREHAVYLEKSLMNDFSALTRYRQYVNGNIDQRMLVESLQFLSELVKNYYGVSSKVHLLIDDYDFPFDKLVSNMFRRLKVDDDRDDILNMLREIFASDDFNRTLSLIGQMVHIPDKERHVEKILLTGTLPVIKLFFANTSSNTVRHSAFRSKNDARDPFAGFYEFTVNDVRHLLSDRLFASNLSISDFYGFRDEHEKRSIAERLPFKTDLNGIVDWYARSDYVEPIFCPWTVMRCLANRGRLDAYWVKTRPQNESLVEEIFLSDDLQEVFQQLQDGGSNTGRPFPEQRFPIPCDEDGLFSLLDYTGYVGYNGSIGRYQIPNRELMTFYRRLTLNWIRDRVNATRSDFVALAGFLSEFDVVNFKRSLQQLLLIAPDRLDASESFFVALFRHVITALSDRYLDETLTKQGLARPDVILVSKEGKGDRAIVLKYKIADNDERYDLKVRDGLNIMDRQVYKTIRRRSYIRQILKLCVLFWNKAIVIGYKIDHPDGNLMKYGKPRILGAWKEEVEQPPAALHLPLPSYLADSSASDWLKKAGEQCSNDSSSSSAEKNVPEQQSQALPNVCEEHGIVFPRLVKTELADYCKAVKKKVKDPEHVVAISEPNRKTVIVFLRNELLARQFMQLGATILVGNRTIKGALLSPIGKITFINVSPLIPDSVLKTNVERQFGFRLITGIKTLAVLPDDYELSHVTGSTREVYATRIESGPDSMQLTYDNRNYTIRLTYKPITCYRCGSTQHLTSSCRGRHT